MSVFSKNFRKYRLSQGLTQQQLAEKMGKSQGCITNYENDWREPKAEEVRAFEKILPDWSRFDIMPDAFGKDPYEGLKVWERVHSQ